MIKRLYRVLNIQPRRISFRFAVAILTFLIGVGLTAVIFVKRQQKRTDSPILPMSVCDVMRLPAQYEFRIVRLKGALVGFHELMLYDPACKSEDNYVRAVLDQSSRTQLGRLASKLENNGLKDGNFFLQVVLIGRIELESSPRTYKDNTKESPQARPIQYRARLIVSSVEQVDSLDTPL